MPLSARPGSSRLRRESSSACAIRRLVFRVPRASLRERVAPRGAAAAGRLPTVPNSEPAMGGRKAQRKRGRREVIQSRCGSRNAYTPPGRTRSNVRRTSDYCGGVPLSLLLDGGGGFLSFFVEVLSPLNTPTILPKKLFFLLASSSAWTPGAGCGFPFVVGGGRAFSEFPPNMREKNPCTPPLWSQVSRGSVPATKAVV